MAEKNLDEQVVTLNPVVGVSIEDLVRSATNVLKQGLLQPAAAVQHIASFGAELSRILVGNSELEPQPKDRRFQAEAFKENPVYSRTAKAWLAWQRSMLQWVDDVGFDEGTDLERARFIVNLFTDALAPPNFLLGNPSALEKAIETKGASLFAGLQNFIGDLQDNHGMPSQVDKSAFKVGENLATTPGAVIHRSEIIELIQYAPTTKTANAVPVLIIPPQINKYYIYDMSAKKSLAAYLVNEGFQVFMVSWRNPKPEHRDWGMNNYVEALIEAFAAAKSISNSTSLNLVGACAGGITLATTLAYLYAQDEGEQIASLTLMVNVLKNATDDSVMGLFTDRRAIEAARRRSAQQGVLDGNDTARVFNWMRPNDLIWNYVAANYLHGESPPAFDILYWNNDTTCLPARLHSDFLDIFQDQALTRPGGFTINGVDIDLQKIICPSYVTGGTTDHITPWQACYRTTQLLGSDTTFVLSTAGHIQSLINPPTNSKRQYFTNPKTPENAKDWLKDAHKKAGSWWPHWSDWLVSHSNQQVPVKETLGNSAYPELVAAPGTYVHE